MRYRFYADAQFYTAIDHDPSTFAPAGTPTFTLNGLHGGGIYTYGGSRGRSWYWNPTVRPFSAQASEWRFVRIEQLTATSFAIPLRSLDGGSPGDVSCLANIVVGNSTTPWSFSRQNEHAAPRTCSSTVMFRLSTVDAFCTESAGLSVRGNQAPTIP